MCIYDFKAKSYFIPYETHANSSAPIALLLYFVDYSLMICAPAILVAGDF